MYNAPNNIVRSYQKTTVMLSMKLKHDGNFERRKVDEGQIFHL